MLHVECEPPPARTADAEPHFIVGQDVHGWWLAIETHNLGGGLFKSLKDALRFVDVETDHRPGAIELATGPVQLRF